MMNMWKVRELMDKATNVVMNYTETEAKVREATNDDAWGPTGAMMQELAQATFTYEQFPEVMSMLWKRMLQENKRNWRRTYKSLLLLNYLVRNGSERVVTSSREHIYDLRSLENYTCIDEFGKDQGINIRHKVRELIDFIQDDDKLREERKKAKKNKDKYVGLSSEAMGMRFGGGDRWMDNPKWNKSGVETYNDWDNRGKGFEDANNSDDGEREDSDNDTSPKKSGREYRDTLDNINQIGKSAQTSIPSTNTSPARTTRTIKKVDLGAAANYGKEQSNNSASVQQNSSLSSPKNQQKTKNDILNDIFESQNDNNRLDDDDFNPRANTQSFAQPQNANADFGDFTSAFNNSATVKTKDSNDEFADFTSAFNNVTISNTPSQPQSQINLMGVTIPTMNNPTVNNMNNSNTMYANTMQTAGTTAFTATPAIQKTSNDLFDTLSPQGLNNQITNNNTVTSNTDLLSDLDSLNAPTMRLPDGRINSSNNSNIFMGINNTPTGNYAACKYEESDVSIENVSNNAANQLLEVLCTMCDIKSSTDLERIRSSISNYIRFLPGSVTPQKYSGIDFDTKVDAILYGRILEEIISKFDRDWPLSEDGLDPLIEKLIIIDGATIFMLSEALRALITTLNESKDEKKTHVISMLLNNLLKSEAIFSGILDACRNEVRSHMQKEELDQTLQNTIQILISLPSRVSNKLQLNTPKSYMPQVYVKILCFHICCAISFINELYRYDIKLRTSVLSVLISKIVVSLKPCDFTFFVDIVEEWYLENKKNERCLVEDIFRELDSAAIEYIAVLFLKHCDSKLGVRPIFGNLIMEPNWKYILTTKIPLMRYYEDEKLLINLVSYLSSFSSENNILLELLIKLLEIWRDRSILNHVSVEQHKYITKLIVLSVKTCKDLLSRTERDQCQKLLLSGVSIHLECTNITLRAMGMIVAEICINSLCNTENVPKLKFEYDTMPAQVLELLQSLKDLNTLATIVHVKEQYERGDDITIGNIVFDSMSSRKIYELGVDCDILPAVKNLLNEKIEENTHLSKTSAIKDNLTKKNETNQQTKSNANDDSDLDSDDDLVPYDMNNDKPPSKVRPMYLRDLRDNLTDERTFSNPDVFSESLLVCEELILTQLSNDDVSFAIELLQLLVTLKQQSYMENFELVIFKCCVAIVTVRPKECAEFLCKEFYEDTGKYSLSHRLLFLDILAESARQLSKIDIKDADNTDVTVDTAIKKKRIPSRISFFIDTQENKRQQVWYNEDFDIDLEASEDQSMNWQEIIDKRIASRTRRFAHNSKSLKLHINHFGNVASAFFYPLLHGFGRRDILKLNGLRIYSDQENILLLRFLKTLSAIMLAAQNCSLASKMGKEILELLWTVRNHDEATVRLAVTENIGSVLIAVPKDAIIDELSEPLMEIREWLLLSQNVVNGEHDANCRALNAKVLAFINLIISSTFKRVD
ncbi:PREDICTED: telomere length regulation protein TEL2 homolog isoform X1 [Trachymyrmex septentrionalis]|uniref:telomere length regulation protein TEL2 homolog isoform X1 n=1 Tax=Trachymyrmex septentrionalis TaxID=34720 RepID=UPI00084F6629|nr:PREDICTED: telomere length regulation protein TEL2 homolog isoform X1 [Trachymyrmex septentrionalis]